MWLIHVHTSLQMPPKKKSGRVKSGERSGQLKPLDLEIMRSLKISRNSAIMPIVVYAVALFCGNHICGWFSIAGLKKFSNMLRNFAAPMVTADFIVNDPSFRMIFHGKLYTEEGVTAAD